MLTVPGSSRRYGWADSSHECVAEKTTPASQLRPLQSTTAEAFRRCSELPPLFLRLKLNNTSWSGFSNDAPVDFVWDCDD